MSPVNNYNNIASVNSNPKSSGNLKPDLMCIPTIIPHNPVIAHSGSKPLTDLNPQHATIPQTQNLTEVEFITSNSAEIHHLLTTQAHAANQTLHLTNALGTHAS